MRISDPGFRVHMWGLGDADGTWHCGLCVLRSMQEENLFLTTPSEAIARVKTHNLTVPDDPEVPLVVDSINRTLLAAPADMPITVNTDLEMLLIDPKKPVSYTHLTLPTKRIV